MGCFCFFDLYLESKVLSHFKISTTRSFSIMFKGKHCLAHIYKERKAWAYCLKGTWSTAQNSFARKNWSTQFFNCSTPFKQMTKKVKTGWQTKIICRRCISSSFTFRQKNINCSNCKWSMKVLENVNCSTQFIVKKMVYMYGS